MQVLQFSVDNKFGHTQKPTDEDGGNFHADHHLLHVKNFGIYNCLTDMYFDTGYEIDLKFRFENHFENLLQEQQHEIRDQTKPILSQPGKYDIYGELKTKIFICTQ